MWELDHKEGWMPRNWWFWTLVLEKTLESPLDKKEIKPISPIKISPGCSLKRLMLKLKLQYFVHLMWTVNSFEKILLLGKTEGKRRGWQRMGWLDNITNSMDVNLVNSGRGWGPGRPGVLEPTVSQRAGHNLAIEQQPPPPSQVNSLNGGQSFCLLNISLSLLRKLIWQLELLNGSYLKVILAASFRIEPEIKTTSSTHK